MLDGVFVIRTAVFVIRTVIRLNCTISACAKFQVVRNRHDVENVAATFHLKMPCNRPYPLNIQSHFHTATISLVADV
jgi:hypothetical protein